MTNDSQLTDHEKRISTIEGCLPGVASDIADIKKILTEGKGGACKEHSAYLRSQWWHIRALYGLVSIGLSILIGSVRKWF